MEARKLADAVLASKRYLARFTREDYPRAFKDYTHAYGPLYQAALEEGGETPEALRALAGAVLDVVDADLSRRLPWTRGAAMVSHKQMLVVYLSPMLLELGAEPLAEAFRDVWGQRRPRDRYRFTTYETYRKGFRNTILGFEMGRREESGEN